MLSLPKDCAAGQEACGQLLTLTVSGEGFSFSWEVQNTTLDEKCLNRFFADFSLVVLKAVWQASIKLKVVGALQSV